MRQPWARVALVAAVALSLPGPARTADDSDCALCHEEVATAFARTAHGHAAGWSEQGGCRSCHGPGDQHIEEGGDLSAIVRPQLLSPRQASDGCLDCHQREKTHFAGRASLHGLSDVGCVDCHTVHVAASNRRAAVEECASCHHDVAGRFEMPRSHPLDAGGTGCVACHDPHGSRRTHARAAGEDACSSCHFDKAGPFLYDHDVSLVDGCTGCHEVHGSTNRHLLRHERQVNLCYECHSANLTPGWHSSRRFTTEKCTACHAAIHGSNTSQFYLEE